MSLFPDTAMKAPTAAIVCGFLLSAYFFHTGTAYQKLDVYDPQSLYKLYTRSWRSGRLSNATRAQDHSLEEPAPGVAYFTPNTEKLINSGSMPRSDLMNFLQGITNTQKMDMLDDVKKLKDCWKSMEKYGRKGPFAPFYCYFYWNSDRDDCQRIYRYRELARGRTTIMLVECLSQTSHALKTLSENNNRNTMSSAGVHIEIGSGLDLLLYAPFSSGMAFNVPERDTFKVTLTRCLGAKFDASAGFGFSVRYLFNKDDLLGESLTVELGLDIPGSKSGIDLLLHFKAKERRFIGYGFALGMGRGLSPIDFSVLSCDTKQIGGDQSSVRIKIGDVGPTWSCQQEELGVVSIDKHGRERICCPAVNLPECSSCMCWFARRDCPVKPASEFSINARKTIALSSCVGEDYLKKPKNKEDCYREWRNNFNLKYGVWRHETKQCWVSDTFSMHTCKWAPNESRDVFIR